MTRMVVVLVWVVLSAASAQAQAPVLDPTAGSVPSAEAPDEVGDGANQGGGKSTPIIAPIPFKNSQIGWGGVLMLGLIHRFEPDTTIKPSTGAVMGLASENGSWGVMGLEVARFKRDTWRVRGVMGYMSLKYDFYGIGIDAGEAGRSVPLDQTVFMTAAIIMRRVVSDLYLGGSITFMETEVSLRDTAGIPAPPSVPDQAKANLLAPGFVAEFDSRNDDYWPTAGSLAQAKGSFFITNTGEAGEFQRYVASWSWYHGFKGRTLVLATNINLCAAPGDPPFYGMCTLGTPRYSLRGYTQGRYRDQYAHVLQTELRGHTAGRWGAVVFGGFGQVADGLGDIGNAKVLPAGGLGLRFQLARKFPMHMRLDYAWGRDGGLLYFAVAEAL